MVDYRKNTGNSKFQKLYGTGGKADTKGARKKANADPRLPKYSRVMEQDIKSTGSVPRKRKPTQYESV